MSVSEGRATIAEPTSAAATARTPGQALRLAREQRGLTLQQIADELHLDMRMAQAIESDDFFALGVPVYAKGYLRKYASLVGLEPDEVIALYERLTDVPAIPVVTPVSSTYQPPSRISLRVPLLLIGTLGGAALFLWLGFFLYERFKPELTAEPAASQVEVPAVVPAPATAVAPTSIPLAPSSDPVPEAPAADPAAANSTADVNVRLQFSAASWVEIYDGADQRLIYEIGQPGQTRTVTGKPPLRITLGVASAVTVAVNGRTVPVPRRADRDAANFTITADGAVR